MAKYIRLALKRHPLLVNSSLYITLYGSGEALQEAIHGRDTLDMTEIRNVAILGGCVFAPFYFHWYKVLDRFFIGTSFSVCLKKTFLDMLFAGTITMASFYIGNIIFF